jgi:single-strand DNA-binding protein
LKLLGDKKTKLCQYIKKGDKIAITGEIDQNKYTDKDGVEKTSYSILVNAIDLPKREQQGVDSHNKAKANGYQEQSEYESDEIPF